MKRDEIKQVLDAIGESDDYVVGRYGIDMYILPFSGSTEKMIDEVEEKLNE